MELSQTWITCDGGPLIVMEKRLLPFWEGSEAPSNGRIVDAESRWGLDIATDYDRACDINAWSGVITVGDGFGLVVSIVGHATSWIPSVGKSGGDLVEWGFADSELDVLKEHEILATLADVSTAELFDVKSSPVVLFAATESGLEPLYERLEFDLIPGKYRIFSRESKNEKTYIIGHQFKVEA
ncbi:MAG: Imm21 family immunity protein [Blastocatellia bacterium]